MIICIMIQKKVVAVHDELDEGFKPDERYCNLYLNIVSVCL